MEILRRQYDKYGTQVITVVITLENGVYTILKHTEVTVRPENSRTDEPKKFVLIHGVARWESVNRVIPDDILKEYYINEVPGFAAVEHRLTYDRETNAFIEEYRAHQARRTPEQIAEQRAEARTAHGQGVTLVDVISGHSYTT